MSENYDNWERLGSAFLRTEHDKEIALNHSRDSNSIGSSSSTTSNVSYDLSNSQSIRDHSLVQGQRNEVPMDYSDLILSYDEWKAMLPPDKHEIVWRSASMGLFLDESTRKNCFILGATKLLFSNKLLLSEDSVHHWERKAHTKSRFSEVAELLDSSSRFSIQARIHAKMLSPETSYSAYLVFGLTENYKNLRFAMSTVRFSDEDVISGEQTRIVHFQSCTSRADGWTEVEMGRFYVHHARNAEMQVTLLETSGNMNMKSGLIVEGIEFRPSTGEEIFSKVRISSNA